MGSARKGKRPRQASVTTPARAGVPVVVQGAGLFLLVLAALWPALSAGFIFDDHNAIVQNALLTNGAGLARIWLHGIPEEHYWPLTYTAFWIQRSLWGVDPTGYHIVNVLLHAMNTLLVWQIFRRIGVRPAWLVAALFGIHPVHVESIAWAIELKDVLSGLCVLLAFWAYLNFLDRQKYFWLGLATAGYIAGLLSKSAVFPFPCVLVIYHWWKGRSWTVRELAPIAVVGAIGTAIATADLIGYRALSTERYGLSVLDRALVASRAIWFYIVKLAWPVHLIPVYPRWAPQTLIGWISRGIL